MREVVAGVFAVGVLVTILLFLFTGCHRSTRGDLLFYSDLRVDPQGLRETVHVLSTMAPPRSYANIESLDAAAGYIQEKFRAIGYTPLRQTFTVNGKSYHNIHAFYPSELDSEGARRVVVGAHYDVFGEFPGADDNASAVAGMLELARLVRLHGPDLGYAVEFVAFALEEPPFFDTPAMGSHVHAESLKRANVQVVGMICLEMIGYYSDQPKSQRYPMGLMKLFYPDRGDFVAVVSNFSSSDLRRHVKRFIRHTPLPVQTLVGPGSIPGVDFSDHRNYWQFGFDAVMVTDTAFYRNPHYHMPTDTLDTLNFEKMAHVIEGLFHAIVNLK